MGQLSLWDEPADWLNEFEQRLRKLRLNKLFWWTKSLRDIFADILARRDRSYEQLMLLENELERGDTAAAKDRIATLKGMLSVLAIMFIGFSAFNASDDFVRHSRGRRKNEQSTLISA
ncbi:MAG: hypothetical protein AAFX93_20030 [Verrucomicrobiota bacterium]